MVTATVTHATPGAFVGHTNDRNDQTLIALQMVGQDVDVVIGGGLKYFLPKSFSGERDDNIFLTDRLVNNGYALTKSYSELNELSDTTRQFYALLEMDGLPESLRRDYSLGDLTKKALSHLKNDSDGFVIMIEGSQIDWAGHDHKSKELLEEMKDFSSAVAEALVFARADKNTLVLITSDHETGGMSVTKGNLDGSELELSYTSGGHTPSPVGIFAYGPGEELFKGIMNINDIGQKLFFLLDPTYKF